MGFEVHENSTAIVLDQSAYVNEIKEIGLATSKDVDFEALKRPFRSLLGQLQWRATQTRPDICFDVSSKGRGVYCNFSIPNHHLQIFDPKPPSVNFRSQTEIILSQKGQSLNSLQLSFLFANYI